MNTTASPRRERTTVAIFILSILLFAIVAFAHTGLPADASALQDGDGPALLVGLHAEGLSPGAPLNVTALAPEAVAAARPLFRQSGVYHDAVLDATLRLEHIYRLQLAPGADMRAVMAQLAQRPEVAFVEPDYVAREIAVPNDPRYGEQWGLHKINAPAAWDVQTGGAPPESGVIAVIDAGLGAHPELAGRLWSNPGEIPGNGVDDDNNGFVDDIHGWNFYGGNADLSDNTGHGTQVAGLIAATGNNGVGVSGVCWACQIMVLKVVQPGGNANYSDIAAAIAYAVEKGASVINLSLGGNSDSAALRAAVAAASNTVLVAGAGNDNNSIPFYPAAYDSVLAVAGTNAADVRVPTSNYGSWVDLSAPGSDVLTTFDGGGYGNATGTSLAAPFASGAAALLHAETGWTSALIRAHLMQTAAPINAANPGYSGQLGDGRLDAGAALTTPAQPDLAAQTVRVDGRANGQPEPGSTVDLQITLTNNWGPTGPLQGTLSSNDAYATVVQNNASFPAVETFGSSQNSTPLRITVAGNAPYGHNLSLRLTLRENGVVVQTIPVRVTVAQQVVNVSGVISSDTTWSGDRVYRLTGNVVVQAGATLTVEAGARVEANADRVLRVQGNLVAVGTEDAPVVFTSLENSPAPYDWQGLEILEGARLELTHCEISYANVGVSAYHDGDGTGEIVVDDCVIRYNGTGVRTRDVDVTVSNSRLLFNESMGASIRVSSYITIPMKAIIQNSEVAYNRSGVQAKEVIGNVIHNQGAIGVEESGQVYSNTIVMNTIGMLAGLPTPTPFDYAQASGAPESNTLNEVNEVTSFPHIQGNNIDRNSTFNMMWGFDDTSMAGNWWGTTDLQAINESIYDFGEDSEVGIVDVQPILTEPSTAAPAYLYDVDVAPDTTIGIQEATLDLKFSAAMDDQTPDVTLVMNEPTTAPFINGALSSETTIGAVQLYETPVESGYWLDETTYRATHNVTAAMPRGKYDIIVTGAFDANGRETPPMTYPAFTVDYAGEVADGTPPPAPHLFASGVDGDASSVAAHWSASDPDSPIIAYRYAIGTTRGGREIVNWTSTTATRLSRSGFGFVEGQTYYFSLQAQNSGGLWSPSAISSFVSGQGDYKVYLPALWGR